MKHLGDITKINGHDVPLVNVVTGGSPCQDLSVAGKRAGLDGERSGLFMEQVRIIKEMRDESISQLQLRGADVDIRFIEPRFMVWENVPGAFSSNHGEDFRCVLEEICRIADKTANVPIPKSGKWSSSGCIMGDRWSIAWRLHDAQFWGVPQRRKRIALVADFGGKSAPEILFERESMSGDIEQSEQERKETPGDIGESPYQSAYTLKIRGGREIDSLGKRAGKGALVQTEKSGTLGVSQDQTLITVGGNSNCNQGGMIIVDKETKLQEEKYVSGLITKGDGTAFFTGDKHTSLSTGGGQAGQGYPCVMTYDKEPTTASKASFFLKARSDGKSDTLVATDYKDPQIIAYGVDCYNQSVTRDKSKALNNATTDLDHIPCIAIDRASFNQGKNAQFDFSIQEDIAQPLVARGPGGVMTQKE